ncbi:efflux RND transporter periplasmic adaptor subunit [Marinihelvus fidelis]|nr:efflux RND transporter periplasmic adaptor subunit [Marinihelvus fidelis]
MKTLTPSLLRRTGVLGLALALLAPAWAQDQMPPATVRVAQAEVRPMAPVTWVPGTVASRNDARLAAEVEGRLNTVADVGTAVAAGDPVATIEDTALRLRRDELAAEVERAQAQLVFLEAEEKRFDRLAQSNLAAATQLEQTRADRDVARGDLAVARSRLAQNEDQLARTVIRAPFDGVVVERVMTPGERVIVGSTVVRVVDQAHLEVIARAPLEYYGYVQPGQRLDLRTRAATAQAVVRTVVAVGDLNTHQFELRLDLLEQRFPVGQTLRVAVPMAHTEELLSVPRDALVLRPGNISVFVVGADDTARQVPVTTGVGTADRIAVEGDLRGGDRVVIRGNERLQPGQSVMVADG